jgi:hypothetical protein
MDAGSNDANVISFERAASAAGNNQLDSAGETILQLIHRAAGFAEENSRHALQMAQAFSDKLRVAEERIAELEAEVDTQQERADRAEQWLHRIYTEIQSRFDRLSDGRRGAPHRPRSVKHRSYLN